MQHGQFPRWPGRAGGGRLHVAPLAHGHGLGAGSQALLADGQGLARRDHPGAARPRSQALCQEISVDQQDDWSHRDGVVLDVTPDGHLLYVGHVAAPNTVPLAVTNR